MEKQASSDETTGYEELAREFAELSDSYYESQLSETEEENLPPVKSRYTGLTSGTIRNVQTCEETIELTVDTGFSTESINIINTGEYTQENEFARLLEWYDISIDSPGKLMGLQVMLVRDNDEWELYLPESLDRYTRMGVVCDRISRLFGIHFVRKLDSAYDVAMVVTVALFFMSIPVAGVSELASNVFPDISYTLLYATSMLLTIVGAAVGARTVIVVREQISHEREKKTIR